jgi:hypothetical protein
MSISVSQDSPRTLILYAGEQLSVTADANSSGNVVLLGQPGSAPSTPTQVAAGTTVTFGPDTSTNHYNVTADTGVLTFSSARIDYPTAPEALAAAATAITAAVAVEEALQIPVVGTIGDVAELIGAGAPVDGMTGAMVAGPGSRYTDITNANLYINGNTKASPTWKLVTRVP